MPVSVSVVIRTIFTNLFSFFAYSTRYIALPIPSGHEIRSAIPVITTVFTSAGMTEQFSDVYLRRKRDGPMCGTPFARMYASMKSSESIVTNAHAYTAHRTAPSFFPQGADAGANPLVAFFILRSCFSGC